MPGPAPATLLRLWEQAEPLDALARAVVLASTDDDAADLTLGQRDARLAELAGAVAGPVLESVAACPSCAEQVSIAVGVEVLLDAQRAAADHRVLHVRHLGFEVSLRPLDSTDLRDAAATGDVDLAERILLERCVVRASAPDGGVAAADALPREIQDAVADALAAADPLAEVLVDVTCPACAAGFTAEVDVAAHTWMAVRHRARALLAEVDTLARAYGWTEPEVLALSETRRHAYLRLVGEEAW